MAAKGAHMMAKLRDETECCICAGTFVDPRVLPCLHTFCLKCLETNVAALRIGPRQLMPCPVCRKEFNIPDSGLLGLQKNFLVERLIDIVRAPDSGTYDSTGVPCEACLEEVDICLSVSVPPSEFYCADCKQKLCNECSVHHRKNKMTKLHAINRLADDSKTKCLLKNTVKRCWNGHLPDTFFYCLDCMDDFCPRCYAGVHKTHKSSSRRKIIDEYNELVDAKIKEFTDVEYHAQKVKKEVENRKDAFVKNIDSLEKLVTERSEQMKKLVDSHTKLLQEDIKSKKQITLENIKLEKERLEKLQYGVIDYRNDCSERKEFLSVETLILTMNSIKAKAENLTQLRKACLNCCDSSHVEFAFRESDIDDFLGKSNVIGHVEEKKTEVPVMSFDLWDQPTEMNHELLLTAFCDEDNLHEYFQNPSFIQPIKMRDSTDDSKEVRGITVLEDELFIVHAESTKLYIYDAYTLDYITDLNISELNDPCDIVSCESSRCLYIVDHDHDDDPYRIFCLNSTRHIIRQWITGKTYCTISVTYDSNIIVAYRDKKILKEYSENGRLLRELFIRLEDGVSGFLHARKLHSGLFLISYSSGPNQHGLSLVDVSGAVVKSVSETVGPGNSLNGPCFFTVDKAGSILLVDRDNRRVLLFSTDMERSTELVTRYNGLCFPRSVFLDESSGRMFVADNWFDFQDRTYRNGRVRVFQVKNV